MDSYKGRQKHGQKDSKTKYMDKKPFKFLQKYIPVIVLRQSGKNLKQQTYNNMDREADKMQTKSMAIQTKTVVL